MLRQSIDTERVAAVAAVLQSVNENINDSCDKMGKTCDRQLSENWKSEAGSAAITLLYELLKGNESRSTVIQNYISFLGQQVDPGYVEAERVNTSLADQFK